jgi:hypothetical protein
MEQEEKQMDRVVCKTCKQEKLRRDVGQSPNGKRKYRHDENGKPWNGNICPGCYLKTHTRYVRQWRHSKQPKQSWSEYVEKAKTADAMGLKELVRQLEEELGIIAYKGG